MGNRAMMLFVPFSPAGDPWVVRRAHTVMDVCPTREQAVARAFSRAGDLAQRLGARVGVQAQDENGGWHVLSPVHGGR